MAAVDVPLAYEAVIDQDTTASPTTSSQDKTTVKSHPKPIPISPAKPFPPSALASPALLRSSSPRLHSPASSEIFERNVQEPIPIASLEGEPRAHLATHVITEDHIPPALEASAQAITSQHLNPDEVEIVTSSLHQTAASSVMEHSTSQLDLVSLNSPRAEESEPLSQSGILTQPEEEATTYGSIDPNDVRRLSFISFADVVQAEHQQSSTGDSTSTAGSLPSSAPMNARARSPLRSPTTSIASGLTTPPLSAVRHVASNEQSPARNLAVGGSHGELTIETMRQAVRKTASGDIGRDFRHMSPVLPSEESGLRRTNS